MLGYDAQAAWTTVFGVGLFVEREMTSNALNIKNGKFKNKLSLFISDLILASQSQLLDYSLLFQNFQILPL